MQNDGVGSLSIFNLPFNIYHPSIMRILTAALITIISFNLTGCASLIAMKSNAGDLLEWVKLSMSGVTIQQPKEYIEDAVQEAKDLKDDVENRIDNVSEGVQKIQDGRDLIKQGLGIDDETGTGSTEE